MNTEIDPQEPEQQQELEKSDKRLQRLATACVVFFAFLTLGGFAIYLGQTSHEIIKKGDDNSRLLDHIAEGKPGTRMECTVKSLDNLKVENRGRTGYYLFHVDVPTKECGKLIIDSETSAMLTSAWGINDRTSKPTYYTNLYHGIQVDKSYVFWVDNSKAKEPQIYKAVPSE